MINYDGVTSCVEVACDFNIRVFGINILLHEF